MNSQKHRNGSGPRFGCFVISPSVTTVEDRNIHALAGDTLCSLTYPMGNIFLLGCVYADPWDCPVHLGVTGDGNLYEYTGFVNEKI